MAAMRFGEEVEEERAAGGGDLWQATVGDAPAAPESDEALVAQINALAEAAPARRGDWSESLAHAAASPATPLPRPRPRVSIPPLPRPTRDWSSTLPADPQEAEGRSSGGSDLWQATVGERPSTPDSDPSDVARINALASAGPARRGDWLESIRPPPPASRGGAVLLPPDREPDPELPEPQSPVGSASFGGLTERLRAAGSVVGVPPALDSGRSVPPPSRADWVTRTLGQYADDGGRDSDPDITLTPDAKPSDVPPMLLASEGGRDEVLTPTLMRRGGEKVPHRRPPPTPKPSPRPTVARSAPDTTRSDGFTEFASASALPAPADRVRGNGAEMGPSAPTPAPSAPTPAPSAPPSRAEMLAAVMRRAEQQRQDAPPTWILRGGEQIGDALYRGRGKGWAADAIDSDYAKRVQAPVDQFRAQDAAFDKSLDRRMKMNGKPVHPSQQAKWDAEAELAKARAEAAGRLPVAKPVDERDGKIKDLRIEKLRKDLDGSGGASGATPGELSGRGLDLIARTWLRTGQMPPLGQGKEGAAARRQVIDRAAVISDAEGIDPVASRAEFGADKGALSTVTRTAGNIGAFEGAARGAMGLVKESSGKVARTDWPIVNRALGAIRTATGDSDQIALNNNVETLASEYARIMGGMQGVTSDSAREHARAMLNAAFSEGNIDAVLAQFDSEFKAREAGNAEEMARIANRIRSRGAAPPTGSPAATDAAPKRRTATDKKTGEKVTVEKQPDGTWKRVQ